MNPSGGIYTMVSRKPDLGLIRSETRLGWIHTVLLHPDYSFRTLSSADNHAADVPR